MDATVSWGGPDYKFKNDTNYPLRIAATYSGGYLTMKLIGTNPTGNYVRMTNKVLSTTPFTVIKQNDASLPAGTRRVTVTPYTGYKVVTYRNVYSSSGTLISSRQEAVSNYKVRNEVILVGTGKSSASESPSPAPGTATGGGTTTGDNTATGNGTATGDGTQTAPAA
jgi:hypothetical protein